MESDARFFIKIPINDWESYTSSPDFVSNYVLRGNLRKKFSALFTRILNEKLQESGPYGLFCFEIELN